MKRIKATLEELHKAGRRPAKTLDDWFWPDVQSKVARWMADYEAGRPLPTIDQVSAQEWDALQEALDEYNRAHPPVQLPLEEPKKREPSEKVRAVVEEVKKLDYHTVEEVLGALRERGVRPCRSCGFLTDHILFDSAVCEECFKNDWRKE